MTPFVASLVLALVCYLTGARDWAFGFVVMAVVLALVALKGYKEP